MSHVIHVMSPMAQYFLLNKKACEFLRSASHTRTVCDVKSLVSYQPICCWASPSRFSVQGGVLTRKGIDAMYKSIQEQEKEEERRQ